MIMMMTMMLIIMNDIYGDYDDDDDDVKGLGGSGCAADEGGSVKTGVRRSKKMRCFNCYRRSYRS